MNVMRARADYRYAVPDALSWLPHWQEARSVGRARDDAGAAEWSRDRPIADWRHVIAADGDNVTTAQFRTSENLTQADQVRRLTLVNRTRRPLV